MGQKSVIKMWLPQKKILTAENKLNIDMQLERSSGDDLVAFCDLSKFVKNVWLHSPVATRLQELSFLIIRPKIS